MSFGAACPSSCPFVAASAPARFEMPVGQVRRVAAVNGEVDETKRNLLKLAAVAGVLGVGVGGTVGGALKYVQPPTVGIASYPTTELIDLDGKPLTATKVMEEYNVTNSELLIFNYPLRNEPNFLLSLQPNPGQPSLGGMGVVPGGVGPFNAPGPIVAYSAICQHLGCPAPALSYYPPQTCPGNTFNGLDYYIHCSCHGSTYDVTNRAANLTGPAVLPLPQLILQVDPITDVVSAVGTTPGSPPVNGHLNTLQGDYGVGTTSQLEKETAVWLCHFPS